MNTKTMIIIGSVAAAGVVLYGLRKKINAMLASQATVLDQSTTAAAAQAKAAAASNMPFGNLQRLHPSGRMPFYGMGDAPAVPMEAAVATTQTVATLVNTSVTTLAGIAGLAITAMTLMEKKRALAK